MREPIDIPLSLLTELDLSDGEKVIGELHGNVVRFTMLKNEDVRPSEEQAQKGLLFLENWKGIGKKILEKDFSDDPRAEYILNR